MIQEFNLADKPIIIVGLKSDLTWAIDTSLIKMINNYAEDECVCSALKGDKTEAALSIMVSSILNHISKEKKKQNHSLSKSSRGPSPHTFQVVFFKSPTWCKFCELFIWGVISPQGYQCVNCKYTCHKRCKDDVPFFCGVE